MKKVLFSNLCVLFLVLSVFAQDRQISGVVTDGAEKMPLPGVSILAKGTSSGTSTDAEGKYRISIPPDAKVLIFSFVGFVSQEVEIGNRTTIDIELMPDTKTLQEVVVTGYGQQIKREVTGNIAKVVSSDIKDMPVPTFDNALQGKAAGVVVNAGSGKLGQGIQVRVRGQSSVSASNEPLYVIDGTLLQRLT